MQPQEINKLENTSNSFSKVYSILRTGRKKCVKIYIIRFRKGVNPLGSWDFTRKLDHDHSFVMADQKLGQLMIHIFRLQYVPDVMAVRGACDLQLLTVQAQEEGEGQLDGEADQLVHQTAIRLVG